LGAASFRNPNRWRQLEDIFHTAAQLDPGSRSAFLEKACDTDPDLRREVESLLTTLAQGPPLFLESAVEGAARAYLGCESALPVTEGSCFDHYRIIQILGAGGMGEVYLAEDTRLKRKVALKVLAQPLTQNPASLRGFEQEAQALSALNHANLLTVFDFGNSKGRYFLVTEYVDGKTLRQLLNDGRLEKTNAVEIATQIAAALSAAHASGVIHRDIKPENIMVRTDGCVKILDFGIAKLVEPADGQRVQSTTPLPEAKSASGMILGTPRYMSPEQARGIGADARTDIFSLGAVFYEMLTGRAAFQGETQSDLIADILRTDPPPITRFLPRVTKDLQLIVVRALAKDRSQRYQKADEMLADLHRLRREEEFQKRLSSSLYYWPLLAALLIGLAFIGFLTIRQRRTSRTDTQPRSLAVLPFTNLRPDSNTDFLGSSLADEVIAKLGYVKMLTVRPSSATNGYRPSSGELTRVAADLRADMLLTGTYLKDGDNLRITARLMGFKPETVLWQKTLDVKYGNLVTVQDSVSRMIIQGLELRLGADEQARLKSDAPVNNLAYEYYLRGVDLYSASNFAAAIVMLEKSAAIDPNYAPTWAHMGRAYTTNASLRLGGRENYKRAEAAYEKAIALNPVFPEPRVYMANMLTDTGRVEEAVPLLRAALRSSPNNAEAHWELGYAYRYGGMLKESAQECELARRLDPEVKINSATLNTYLYMGEYDKFLNSLPSNDSPLLVFYHGLGSYYKHNYAEAGSDFDRAYELAPELLQAQIGKSMSDGLHHHAHSGILRLKETERQMNARGVSDPEAMYKIAQAYVVLGDRGDALRMLQRSTAGGFFCYSYMARDPLLNPVRNSPEFIRTLEEASRRHEQFQHRFGGEGS
jgi:serine/threonine protein kinase/Tfp pilus assembly protein PilF